MSVSYGGDSITFADGSITSTGWTGFKNRIINGGMVIDQRNAGASVTPSTGTYTLDRYRAYQNVSGKFTVQQSSTAPAGFTNSALITSTSAYTASGTDLFLFMQYIEGYNVADLGWGTANAQPITLSFWVRSSLTGTFGGAIVNGSENRSYPFTYTISQANTWEKETITIPGDTTGTWLTTNGLGMEVNFGIGSGSSYSGTAGAWTAAAKFTATGATSIVGTSGATWYITGLQVEKGSTASSFEYRPYGTELALCQRYYVKTYNIGVVPGTAGEKGGSLFNYKNSNSNFGWNFQFPVQMRTTPSFTTYSHAGTAGKASVSTTDFTVSTNGPINGDRMIMVYGSAAIADDGYVHVAATAEI